MRLLTNIWNKLFYVLEFPIRYIWGRDIFISYSRRDTLDYPENLVVTLQDRVSDLIKQKKIPKTKLSFYLDKFIAPPSGKLPSSLVRHLRWSSMLVILCTEKAFASDSKVTDEVELFSKLGRKVLLVNVNNVLSNVDFKKSPWKEISGASPEDESSEAVESSTPSENVIVRILESAKFTKQDKRLKQSVWGTALFVLALLGLTAIVSYSFVTNAQERVTIANQEVEAANIKVKTAEVEVQTAQADAKRITEQAQKDVKDAKLKEADANQKAETANKLADEKNQLALEKTKLADEKTKIADLEAKRADEEQEKAVEQTKIAEEQQREAEKQGAIAYVRQLSNESSFALSQNNPKLLKQSLKKALEANRISEENRLNLIEPILSLRKVLSVTPEKTDKLSLPNKPSFPLSKPLAECNKFAFSTNYKSLACLSNGLVEIFDTTKKSKKIDFNEDLRGKGISYEPIELSISDDGNTVALAIKKLKVSEEEDYEKDCQTVNSCRIVVRNFVKNPCDGIPCIKEIYDVKAISLSPQGDFLVVSGIRHGDDVDIDYKNFLTFWNINSSGEAKDLVVGSSELKGNFSSNGRVFAVAGKAGISTFVQTFSLDSNERQYSLSNERAININYDEVKDVAVDDFGENIALQANGISVWQFDSYTSKALIPINGEGHISAFFTEIEDKNEIIIFNYPYRKNEKKEINLGRQTWSIVGDEGSKVCKDECDKILYGFTAKDIILLMPENQSLIAEPEGTILIVRDKSNNKEIDRIDVGETIEKFGFLENGNEITTVSYVDTGEHSEGLKHRYPRKVRKWKIGFQNLKIIADERLKQL